MNITGQAMVNEWLHSGTFPVGKKIKQTGAYYYIIQSESGKMTGGNFIVQ